MKYRIDLTQSVTEGCTVYVEAQDQDAAENAALQMAIDGTVEWKFVEVEQEAEILGVEPCPPEPQPPYTEAEIERSQRSIEALFRAAGMRLED
ncbi:MAG TPA: hypothetical protein VJN66_08630 [Rhodanobacteraceae bacterium]|nr:hypothetical protein [Rhodanobacteraceae bacterium]